MRKSSTEKQAGPTKQIGYRVPKILLDEFDGICEEKGLDRQAQLKMMLKRWIAEQGARASKDINPIEEAGWQPSPKNPRR